MKKKKEMKNRKKIKTKAQALAEYFLIFAVIASLTLIGITSLLPSEDEPGVIKEAAENYYDEKISAILGSSSGGHASSEVEDTYAHLGNHYGEDYWGDYEPWDVYDYDENEWDHH